MKDGSVSHRWGMAFSDYNARERMERDGGDSMGVGTPGDLKVAMVISAGECDVERLFTRR